MPNQLNLRADCIFGQLLLRYIISAAPRLRDISTLSPPPLTVGDLALTTLIWVSPFFARENTFQHYI